jgi:hypothetical protein
VYIRLYKGGTSKLLTVELSKADITNDVTIDANKGLAYIGIPSMVILSSGNFFSEVIRGSALDYNYYVRRPGRSYGDGDAAFDIRKGDMVEDSKISMQLQPILKVLQDALGVERLPKCVHIAVVSKIGKRATFLCFCFGRSLTMCRRGRAPLAGTGNRKARRLGGAAALFPKHLLRRMDYGRRRGQWWHHHQKPRNDTGTKGVVRDGGKARSNAYLQRTSSARAYRCDPAHSNPPIHSENCGIGSLQN